MQPLNRSAQQLQARGRLAALHLGSLSVAILQSYPAAACVCLQVQHAAKRARLDEGGAAAAGPSAAAPEADEEAAEAAALRRIRESEVQVGAPAPVMMPARLAFLCTQFAVSDGSVLTL